MDAGTRAHVILSPKRLPRNAPSVPRRVPRAPSLLWFGPSRLSSLPPPRLGDVNAVEVVGSKGTVTLGALPLSGVVTHLQAFVAEHVEALGEHRLLIAHVAAGAAQLRLQT